MGLSLRVQGLASVFFTRPMRVTCLRGAVGVWGRLEFSEEMH